MEGSIEMKIQQGDFKMKLQLERRKEAKLYLILSKCGLNTGNETAGSSCYGFTIKSAAQVRIDPEDDRNHVLSGK